MINPNQPPSPRKPLKDSNGSQSSTAQKSPLKRHRPEEFTTPTQPEKKQRTESTSIPEPIPPINDFKTLEQTFIERLNNNLETYNLLIQSSDPEDLDQDEISEILDQISDTYFALAMVLSYQNKYLEAITVCSNALTFLQKQNQKIDSDPLFFEARFIYKEGIKSIKDIDELWKLSTEFLKICLQKMQLNEAISILNHLLTKRLPFEKQYLVISKLVNLYLKNYRFSDAKNLLEKALQIPTLPQDKKNTLLSLLASTCERGLGTAANNLQKAEYLLSLGKVHYSQGNFKAAYDIFVKCLELPDTNPNQKRQALSVSIAILQQSFNSTKITEAQKTQISSTISELTKMLNQL